MEITPSGGWRGYGDYRVNAHGLEEMVMEIGCQVILC